MRFTATSGKRKVTRSLPLFYEPSICMDSYLCSEAGPEASHPNSRCSRLVRVFLLSSATPTYRVFDAICTGLSPAGIGALRLKRRNSNTLNGQHR
jgi:hypothetical protein